MKRCVILSLLLAAVAHSGFANTDQEPSAVRDGSTPERAIIIPHSKRPFDDLAWSSIRQRFPTMVFCEAEPRPAVHLVGFLSQKDGGELRIFNAAGEAIVTRHYEAVIPMDGAVGGLRGPKSLN